MLSGGGGIGLSFSYKTPSPSEVSHFKGMREMSVFVCLHTIPMKDPGAGGVMENAVSLHLLSASGVP